MSTRGWLAWLARRKRIDFDPGRARAILARHQVEEWFFYAFSERPERWFVWWSSLWLARRLGASARILETGCGTAWNLIWFGQHGFRRLYGLDPGLALLRAGRELGDAAGVPLRLWQDDGLAPALRRGASFDAILALNWTYHLDAFELGHFLATWAPALARGGYLVIDVVDVSWRDQPEHRWRTSDWRLPVAERRPSEYRKLHSGADVERAAAVASLAVVCREARAGPVPRVVYVLTPRDSRTG